MTRRVAWSRLGLCGALLTCAAGCGFKGPLYLPERNPTVVTHTARSTPAAPTSAARKKAKSSPASSPQPPSTPQSPTPAAPPPQ